MLIRIIALVDRLTIGSRCGSASLGARGSIASEESAMFDELNVARESCAVFYGRTPAPLSSSYIEIPADPDIFDGESQPQKQLHRHCEQNAHCKKLKRQILQDAGLGEQLALEFAGYGRPLFECAPRLEKAKLEWGTHHQPMEKQHADQEKCRHHNQPEEGLHHPIRIKNGQAGPIGNNFVQIPITVKNNCIVVPRLSRPKPNPARSADESTDYNQEDPHQESPAEHVYGEAPLPVGVIAVTQWI